MATTHSLDLRDNTTYLLLTSVPGGFDYAIFATTDDPATVMFYDRYVQEDGLFAEMFLPIHLPALDTRAWVLAWQVASCGYECVHDAFALDISRAEQANHPRLERNVINQARCFGVYLVLERIQRIGFRLPGGNTSQFLAEARDRAEHFRREIGIGNVPSNGLLVVGHNTGRDHICAFPRLNPL